MRSTNPWVSLLQSQTWGGSSSRSWIGPSGGRSRRLRIVAGRWGGRRIASAPGSRPTSERTREALFSIWASRLSGVRFLDLFCGGGAIGLEAASRGADFVGFVDRNERSLATVRSNCGILAFEEFTAIRELLPAGLARRKLLEAESFALVYADPPYSFQDYDGLLLRVTNVLAEEGVLAVEHDARTRLAADLEELTYIDQRNYGDSALSFFRRSSDLQE